jgi:nicotinamidase-related amidase
MKHLDPKTTLVLVVDVQERLVSAMPASRVLDVERATRILVGAARLLGAQVAYTEQYPKGLGATLPSLLPLLQEAGAARLEKTSFSVTGAAEWNAVAAAAACEAIVVVGMEAHVCVAQSVRDLTSSFNVHVAADGVCSRRDDHRELGLGLCAAAGALLTTAESVVFDWLGDAAHPEFKAVSKLVR